MSEVLDRERAGADDSPLLDAIGRLQNPRALAELAITKFLKSEMWIPRSAENAFALARTAEHGDWICAFTSIPRLAEYQRKANPPWPGAPITLTGANLLRKMREQRLRVGVLVNPQADPNPDLGATLPLPPEVVDKITADLG